VSYTSVMTVSYTGAYHIITERISKCSDSDTTEENNQDRIFEDDKIYLQDLLEHTSANCHLDFIVHQMRLKLFS
jgi:hypothetical protein